jgi:hypothetical protein
MGTVWTVRHGLDDDELREADEWGRTIATRRTIWIRSDADFGVVFMHELFHAIEHAFNEAINMTESEVQLLARGTVALFVDNAWLKKEVFG